VNNAPPIGPEAVTRTDVATIPTLHAVIPAATQP